MRRFLDSKLTIIALVLSVVTLITGVTWAANSSSTGNASTPGVVEVVAFPITIEVGGQLQIAGGGFQAGEVVLFELVLGPGDNLILKSGFANDSGAFLSTNPALSKTVVPGIYTIQASIVAGVVATTPVVVIEAVK